MQNLANMMKNIAHHSFEASPISTAFFPNMAHKIHVLLVEHDSKDHDKAINMLQYFSYKVTAVKLASTAVSILSKGKARFDLVLANINSPDSYGFRLLQDATKMDLLVILMLDQNDAITTVMALEQGAYLCIKKPVTMQIVRYLWQHVLREKTGKIKEHQRLRQIADCNMLQKKLGEDLMLVSHQNNNQDVEEMHMSKKKVKTGTSQHDYVTFKTKVWTEWTEELHQKFMTAIMLLGEGNCYPKEILELMNVPGLTRMQVASHLQKCRNANLLPPNDQRKWKLANAETKLPKTRAPRTKKVKFGSMPRMSNHQFHLQENHNKNQQENVTVLPIENNALGDNFCGSFDKGCYPQVHLDHNHSFAQDNETFDMTQFEQTFRMDEPFIDAANASSYQNDASEDVFEFPNMDTMVHDFSDLLAELGMDYDRSFQSLVLDQNQVPNTDLWSHEVPKSVNAEEIEGRTRKE